MRAPIAPFVMATILIGCDDIASNNLSPLRASADRLEADIRFLSDDLLEGREAGTRGYDLAALSVSERFRALGLAPGGDDGTYYQAVPMLEYEPGATAGLMIGEVELVPGEDYLVLPSSNGETIEIKAPLVFGGMCFASRRENRDDFEGLDLDGKIVACMIGAPKFLNSEELAHYGATQSDRVSEHGAIGLIMIYTRTFEEVLPFEILKREFSLGFSLMTWLEDDGTPFSSSPNVKAEAFLSLAGAKKVFANVGQSWEEIIDAAESDAGDVGRYNFDIDSRIHIESRHRRLTSNNVVGILPGSDPKLDDEYVMLTAHLDHEGVKPTVDQSDDEIYNGALDNASGISALLEVARLLKAAPPKRSVMFIALTAEETGLNGSDYFARHPTVPADSMVAVVNLDLPIVTFAFTDILAFGAERSTLHGPVKKAAEAHGLVLSPDPIPEEGVFTRSDHYSFVKEGVPAVYVLPGFANGGEESQTTFLKTHYHEPSDEVGLVDFDALRRFTDVNADITRNIANMPERPVWNASDFFGTTFGGPMATE